MKTVSYAPLSMIGMTLIPGQITSIHTKMSLERERRPKRQMLRPPFASKCARAPIHAAAKGTPCSIERKCLDLENRDSP